ncbi:SOS response-associated peptidase [Methylosinus sp. Ce-a6]|uniref:SOS response-associated peptidase n=1 Tax=Methylosinus sp. Ce-a6 TaxID=2172005 RepID=UPI00278BEB82|nr:SOS response-associated peptidase [Methylosinus sp. Ce-a6]
MGEPAAATRLPFAPSVAYPASMCGRFTQSYTWAEVHAFLSVIGPPRNLRPRYNIAPTTTIDVVRSGEAGREILPMRWGLVPSWWKKPLKELPSTFNARAESVAEKPMFRSAFKSRRCIVVASGFYEWTGKAGAKTPHYFSSPAGEPLAFAGLWESWRDPETTEPLLSATIVVGAANEWMSRFHDRMPVLLAPPDFDAWLTGAEPGALLRPPPTDALREWVVSNRVNRSGAGDDDASLTAPIVAEVDA